MTKQIEIKLVISYDDNEFDGESLVECVEDVLSAHEYSVALCESVEIRDEPE